MAWVLKMDEVIESGLVHDFDASLSGIGQELGAGAYSMRYRAPWAGRAEASVSLGEGLRDPGPLPGAAAPGGPRASRSRGPGPAAWSSGPGSPAGLCPDGWQGGGGGWERAWLRETAPEGFIFAGKLAGC